MSDAAKQAEALRACLKSIERLLIAMDAANVAPFVPGQALAAHEAAKPEPVAYRVGAGYFAKVESIPVALRDDAVPLYAAPVAAAEPRKPLTRSQINKASGEAQTAFCLGKQPTYEVALARAIEQEHGIKEKTNG